jgi:hypothetical protein
MYQFNGYIFSRNDLNKLQGYLNDSVVGFISAFRPDYQDTRFKWAGENSDRQRSLGRSLGALGLGYVALEGHWQEPGGNYEKEHWGEFEGGHDEVEKTFAVLNNSPKGYSPADFIDILRHVAEAYEQQAVMIAAPKSGDVRDSFGNVLLAGHGYYYEQDSGYRVPVEKGTFHADMVGDWVEVNGEVVGRGYSRTPGRKGRTFVFNYFDFKEAREHIFNTMSTAPYFYESIRKYEEGPVAYFKEGLQKAVSGVRSATKSRRGLRSDLTYADFDQWRGAVNIYCSLGVPSLRSWMRFQGYSQDAQETVLGDLNRTLARTVPGSEPITSSTGPRTLAAWALYEKAQKLKAGGLSYKETVNLLAREADILPKEVKDIIGTSQEWFDGAYDYGLEPLHPDEAAEIQSQADRDFSRETQQIYASVVAKQDPVKDQFLSGQINLLGAIDELVASGMDYEEAEELANSWLP